MSFLRDALVLTYHTTTKISTKFQLFHYLLQLDTALLYAGTIENKGWEVQFNATHLKLLISDGLNLNWTQKFSC
jgi:hypothetical protein